jgi:hypothetical protein
MGVPVFPAAAQPRLENKATKTKARQGARIKEFGAALTASGLFTLDEQARALGLSRSTAWVILKANHKASGLTAATINRMLSSPELPPSARATILTYVEEKLAGLYGHNKIQLRRFAARFNPATPPSFANTDPCPTAPRLPSVREAGAQFNSHEAAATPSRSARIIRATISGNATLGRQLSTECALPGSPSEQAISLGRSSEESGST